MTPRSTSQPQNPSPHAHRPHSQRLPCTSMNPVSTEAGHGTTPRGHGLRAPSSFSQSGVSFLGS
jgi:hypothetical protein